MYSQKGIAPALMVLILAIVLGAGVAVGAYKEQIKNFITGNEPANNQTNQAQGLDKFELEGVITAIDTGSQKISVQVKSSTKSIAAMRNSDVQISTTSTTTIVYKDQENPRLEDIPLDAQVHVGGEIKDTGLVATKIIVQKEEAGTQSTRFHLQGTVKAVSSDKLTVTVKNANKLARDQKGKDVEIRVTSNTIIIKDDAQITLADIDVDDKVNIQGILKDNVFTASKIVVAVPQKSGELEESANNAANNASNNASNKSKSQNAPGQNKKNQ